MSTHVYSATPGRRPDHDAVFLSKVPEVTLLFWLIKICATTFGETGGDALSMTLNLGYAVSTVIFLGFFAVTLFAQLRAHSYHPVIYWAVVIATTTVGTTTSDYIDRTLGWGYVKSSVVLLGLVLLILLIWKRTTGEIKYDHIFSPSNEFFYWVTILISNTLGTALGDCVADTSGLGFEGGALVFAALIALVAALHYWSKISTSIVFWAAYVLTRPLGATLGDILTKPTASGGLDLGRFSSSLVILVVMIALIVIAHRRTRPAIPQESVHLS